MPLTPFLEFSAFVPPKPVYLGDEIPEEMDLFFRSIENFFPEGKTSIDQLTPEELAKVHDQYRFDPVKPGIYQTMTGYANSF